MARSDDFIAYKAQEGYDNTFCMVDLTPTQLSTADVANNTGTATATGPWMRNPGSLAALHVEISDTTTPTSSVVVEYSNTKSAKGAVQAEQLDFTTAGQGLGVIPLNGYPFVRVRQIAVSGSGAYTTATLAWRN